MGFIAFCALFCMVGYTLWNPKERQKAIAEAKESPLASLYMVTLIIFAAMFFFGIFIPIFGEIEIADTGWHVWSAGGVGFFGMTVLMMFFGRS